MPVVMQPQFSETSLTLISYYTDVNIVVYYLLCYCIAL